MAPPPYLPLLTDWTEEDRAAKGLRRGPALREVPVHRTALELAAEARLLLLLAPPGGGRSAMLAHLARFAAPGAVPDPVPVPRNDDGAAKPERWEAPPAEAVMLRATGPAELATLLAGRVVPAGALLLLDDAERLGESGPGVLQELSARADCRVVVAGEAEACGGWALPPGFRRHRLLPLLAAQREALPPALRGEVTALPGMLALAQRIGEAPASVPALLDRWLARAVPAAALPAVLADAVAGASIRVPAGMVAEDAALLAAGFVRPMLVARALEGAAPAALAARFAADAARGAAVLRHVVARRPDVAPALAGALLATGDAGVLLASELAPDLPGLVVPLARIVVEGRLGVPQRAAAGRALARCGDPRDLEELVAVPAGEVAMGSVLHANSSPPHRAAVGAFRIGRYPVTVRLYRRFVAASGRGWVSPVRDDVAADNLPATDLTWRDAVACCAWLTAAWRAEGRIGPAEVVRLPTEPEWEWAARGAQPRDDLAPVHPWRDAWDADRCNGEASGLNAPCVVGMFPRGRSPFGCDDMAGQVWEWCSTLWGADMARPDFAYPYVASDGREAAAAPDGWRRVLRGGCFSSGPEKATAHYRGSLEPDGFWRGNGFRVVVA